jgi:hypothetical protein
MLQLACFERPSSCFQPAASRLRLLYELQVQSNADFLACHQPAGLDGRVPGQPEVLAIDLRSLGGTSLAFIWLPAP